MKKLPEIDGISVHCAHAKIEPVGKLKPYPKNNKTHPEAQIEMMCKAIKAQGWRAPITVSNQTGYIVRGHARLEAAKRLGLKRVPVDYQNYASTEAENMDRIADNKLSELAEWNLPNLKDEIEKLDSGEFDMELTGFTQEEIEGLMTQFHQDEPADAEPQTDKAAELNKKWKVKTGDLYTIGDHRLLCGDSTKAADVARVMDGSKAGGVVFDPEWDDMPPAVVTGSVLAFCDGATIGKVFERYGSPAWAFAWDCVTSWYTPNRPLRRMKLCLWYGDVSTFNLDGSHYGNAGEQRDVVNTRGAYTFKPDPRGKHLSDVFQSPITKLHACAEHSHSKPLDWVRMLIADCTTGLIYDPFLGSGTTMVAAQNLNRKCYGIEISPAYCAVILQRMRDAFPDIKIEKAK